MALTDTKRVEVVVPVSTNDAEEPAAAVPRSSKRAVLIQFVQFCLVGAVSTALNEFLFNLFWPRWLEINSAYTLAFTLAVTNGFLMNRAWTFRRSRAQKAQRQYVMFVAVNLVGLGLSLAVMRTTGAWLLAAGRMDSLAPLIQRLIHRPLPVDRMAYFLSILIATVPCSIWNFTANKLWTFRGHHT